MPQMLVSLSHVYLRCRLASKGIVPLGVALSRCVCPPSRLHHVLTARCISLGGEGNPAGWPHLKNLEYLGISLNTENSGNSVQPQRKIVTNKVVLVHHSNICVKQLLTG